MNMNPDDRNNIPDQDLLDACLEGKQWAWEIFYKRFFRLIYSVIDKTVARHGKNLPTEDVLDCKQAVWTLFLEDDCKKLRQWQKRCSLATWLRVCTCNFTINYFRSSDKLNLLCVQFEDIPRGVLSKTDRFKTHLEDRLIKKQMLKKVRNLINTNLSDRERFFATLYWLDGLSFKEISNIMHVPSANLHLLKFRIVKKIKRHLEDSV